MGKIKKVKKIWGNETWIANTELYCGKLLELNFGKRCSIHYHKNKDETFYILRGKVLMEVEGKEIIMKKEDSIRIKPNTKHRFSGLEKSIIFEISTHHEDSDSYREELSGNIPQNILKKYH